MSTSTLLHVAKVALLMLGIAAYYFTWHLLINNGTQNLMADIRDNGPHHLPGTREPLVQKCEHHLLAFDLNIDATHLQRLALLRSYPSHFQLLAQFTNTSYLDTGIRLVDYQLTVLNVFFYPLLSGSHPSASLQLYHFAGSCFAGYALLLVEGLRNGNRWTTIALYVILVPLPFTKSPRRCLDSQYSALLPGAS